MLPKGRVQLPFGQGLAQQIAPALVPEGKLLQAAQATLVKAGSIQQRPGTDALATEVFVEGGFSSSLSTAKNIFAAGRETVITTPDDVYSYEETDEQWQYVDKAYEATIHRVIQGERGERGKYAGAMDICYLNGWYAIGWCQSIGTDHTCYVRFVDAETEARTLDFTWTVAKATTVRFATVGNKIYATYYDSAAAAIKAAVFDSTDVETGPTHTSVGFFVSATNPVFDVTSSSTNLFVAYHKDNGTEYAATAKWNAGLTVSTEVGEAATDLTTIAVALDASNNVYTSYTTWTGVGSTYEYYTVGYVALTMAYLFAPLLCLTYDGVPYYHSSGGGTAEVCVTFTPSSFYISASPSLLMGFWVSSAGAVTNMTGTYHLTPMSKPLLYNSKWYCLASLWRDSESYYTPYSKLNGALEDVHVEVRQNNAFLVELRKGDYNPELEEFEDANARTVVRAATHIMGAPVSGRSLWPVSTGLYAGTVPMLSETNIGDTEGADIYLLKFDHPDLHIPVIAQTETVLSGGVPAMYDSDHVSEYGFNWYPFIDQDYEESATGGHLTAGRYQFCFVYEWTDAKGIRHQSAPSVIYELDVSDLGGTGICSIEVDVANLTLTEHQDLEDGGWPVKIVCYRTALTASNLPSGLFYRDQEVDNVITTPWTTVYVGALADDDLELEEILYTDGGVLANDQPPSFRHIVQHDRHLWGISNDDPTVLWVSKVLGDGFRMPGFSRSMLARSDLGGANVALASLDGVLYALKENGIFSYDGSPPNDLLQDSSLNGPREVALHTGCVNPKSVVVAPTGIAFQSKESIWLLNRGRQCIRIGAAVEDLLATYPRCRGAVLDQEREIVLFNMTDQENLIGDNPSAGVTLVWHYLIGELGEWTYWHYPASEGGTLTPGFGAAMCWRGTLGRNEYHQTQSDGTVIYHDNGYHDHNDVGGGSSVPSMVVSTPWIQFAGLAGFQRVRRFALRGTYLGPHQLDISIFYNFSATAGTTKQYNWTEVAALVGAATGGTEEQIDIHIPNQKCKAIRVQVTSSITTAPVSGGQVRWESFALELAGKQGLFKLPAVARR